MKILKDIDELKSKIRDEMSTRMDVSDIVEILEVLEGAECKIKEYKWGLASNE